MKTKQNGLKKHQKLVTDNITGKIIDGKREHNENLLKHDCRIQEKGEFEDVKKHGQNRINAEMDRAIDKSVDAIASQIDF